MKLIIDIDKEIYKSIKIGMRNRDDMAEIGEAVENGTPLDDIKTEIENIEINGYIRDVECFSAGINTALNVIDKYKAESEPQDKKDGET